MIHSTDKMGNVINLQAYPKRIISLVPSQTELLYDLGLENEVIGITKFCIHPEHWHKNKIRIGGTKNIHIEQIKALQPDLVIANKEENVKEQIEAIQAFVPAWISDINNLDDALDMMKKIGALTGTSPQANSLAQKIADAFLQIQPKNKILVDMASNQSSSDSVDGFNPPQAATLSPVKIAYLIWQNPYMTVGGDTFIGDMIRRCGLQNVFEDERRYPVIMLEDLMHSGCNAVMLSTEPFPFSQKHIDELQVHLPDMKILLVDGEMFSWYGSRLLPAAGYLKQLKTQINTLVS